MSSTVQQKTLAVLATVICLLTLCLLFVGAMVTSTGSGLSVPDWPTTFGQNMYAYPLSEMRGGVVYEHSHRLFASAIGFLTIVLTLTVWLWESRRWVKYLALTELLLVCLQGLLGGLTVKFKLPVAVSSAHAGVAELFFCGSIWLMWSMTASWKKNAWKTNAHSRGAFALATLVYVQILVGAVMRHSYAGLAIPTFPRAFDGWIPSFWSQGIFLNFLHTRIGALMVSIGSLILISSLLRKSIANKFAWMLFGVLAVQVVLGVLTIWTVKVPWIASLHLACGALLFGTLITIALWSGKQDGATA